MLEMRQLADEIGVFEDDLASWTYCEKAPNTTAVIKLISYLGAEFGTELLSLAGIRCMPVNE